MVGADPDLGDGRRVEHRAAGHRHPARERRRRADERVARVHAERAVRLVGGLGPLPPVVVERRAQQRAEEHLTGRPQLAAAQLARLVAQVGLPTS